MYKELPVKKSTFGNPQCYRRLIELHQNYPIVVYTQVREALAKRAKLNVGDRTTYPDRQTNAIAEEVNTWAHTQYTREFRFGNNADHSRLFGVTTQVDFSDSFTTWLIFK